ncbi:hypothetical protein QUF90_08345 [Desulfococcaceae bacterium HSG9]|nr:hypothetical protein [Desulfococcaceae bacterium HSG9]
MKFRNSKKYDKLVFVHPNFYSDDTIYFIRKTIFETIPELKEILPVNKSLAIIYNYLRKRHIDKNVLILNEGSHENILHVNISQNTTNISLYRVECSKFSKSSYNISFKNKGSHERINVLGGGNLLDKKIAKLIDSYLTKLLKIHDDNKSMSTYSGIFIFFPCFERIEDDAIIHQERALYNLLDSIHDAKTKLDNETKCLSIRIPYDMDLRAMSFLYMTDDSFDLFKKKMKNEFYLRKDDYKMFIDFPLGIVNDYLKKEYLSDQIFEPLNSIIRDGENNFIKVNSVIISEEYLCVPYIKDNIVEYINNLQDIPVNIHTIDFRNIFDIISEGALYYGINTNSEGSTFLTLNTRDQIKHFVPWPEEIFH